MDALLLQRLNLVFLVGQDVQLEHFKEGVSVLGGELDCKVEVVLSICELAVSVLREVSHRDPGSLAPNLATLGDFSQGLVERAERLVELLFRLCPGVL